MSPATPEALARQQIDAQLVAAGWTIQDYKAVDFSASRGIALREGLFGETSPPSSTSSTPPSPHEP